MVLQVEADLRTLDDRLDLQQLELFGSADARQHQQLGRVVGAAGEDHLALGPELVQLAQPLGLHANGSVALEQHAVDLQERLDGEVRTRHRWVEVGHGGRAPLPVALGDLVAPEAVLLGAIEVLVAPLPRLIAGLQEGLGHRVA